MPISDLIGEGLEAAEPVVGHYLITCTEHLA